MNVIEVKKLSKSYHSFFSKNYVAVDNISFQLKENEVLGYLGPNGAGKTTTIKILCGLIKKSSGEVSILGDSCDHLNSRRELGYLPEGPYFYEHLSAEESLYFYGSLFKLKKNDIKNRVDKLLEQFDLNHVKNKKLKEYSKGMRQRLGFAQCLINDPKIVILDEPMSGLDPIGRQLIRDAILNLKKNGKTVLMCSHILHDVEMICDNVVMLNRGKIIKRGAIHEILNSSKKCLEIHFKCKNEPLLKSFLTDIQYLDICHSENHQVIVLNSDIDPSAILKKMIDNEIKIISVIPINQNLEDYFMKVAI